MTPLHATLTGAHGIRAGLNRDTLTLDLAAIPSDALTVAIRGDNGMGKSTILNLALCPWREPPQLPGQVYDEFGGPTGLRELVWTHGGATYRTRIEYRQTGKTKAQRAYLHVLRANPQHVSQNAGDGADWQPVTLPDHTVSDGKSSTYDACLAHILGDQGIYYLSAFRAQNAPKLAAHADPKALMRALLDLDPIAAQADQVAQVGKGLRLHLEETRTQTAVLAAIPEQIASLDAAILDLSVGHTARVEAKLAAIDAASRARAELDRAMSGDLDRQRLLDQRAAVQVRIEEARQAGAAAVDAARREHVAAEARHESARQQRLMTVGAIQGDMAAANTRAQTAARTLAERDAIAEAEATAADLAAKIDAEQQSADALSDRLADLRDLAGKVRTLEAQQRAAADAGKAAAGKTQDIRDRIADLHARAGFVALVPCKGAGEFAACPALQDALAAAARATETAALLPDAEAITAARRADWKASTAQIAALAPQCAALPSVLADHSAAVDVLTSLRRRLDAVRAIAARGSALALAEQHHAEALAAVADLTARLERTQAAAATQIYSLEADAETARAAVATAQAAAETTCAALAAELAAIPEPGTDQAVIAARAALAQAEAAVETAKGAMDEATAAKARHAAEVAALSAALAQGAAVLERARRLESEIADWTMLGLGLRGVIDLSIEDAGPGIAASANRLLAEAYGPRFSVRIVTQREQANGKTVECFDITVLDSETGTESSIIHKSGGESVWLDKALTDAVGLYHQESAGVHYETLFADEAEDGLTAERKTQFYQMDRAALEIGGYARKYFISHNPDAWALADYVIDLADYRRSV